MTSPWVWGPKQETPFQNTKKMLSEDTTLVYFDPCKESELAVDPSPTGLGLMLSQQQEGMGWAPVTYASRALTETEQRYSHIENEALPEFWKALETWLLD